MIQSIFPVFCLFANFAIIFANVVSLVQCAGNTVWRSCWKHGCGVTAVSWVLAYISTQMLSFLSRWAVDVLHTRPLLQLWIEWASFSLSLSFSEEDKQPLLFMMSASWMDTEQQQASNAPRRLMQTLQVLFKLSIITSFTTSSCIIWLKPSECPLVSTVPHYCTKPNFIHTYMLYMYYALLDNVKLK